MDFGGRWRTVDESGTGLRAGTSRPPDMPSDAYEYLQRGKPKDTASSSAAPVMVGVENGSHQPWSSTDLPPRITIDIGEVISKYFPGKSKTSEEWFTTRNTEVPRAMLSIRELVKRFGADNVCIISKAGPRDGVGRHYWLQTQQHSLLFKCFRTKGKRKNSA